MKTYYKYIVVFVTIAMVLSACATATEAPAAATVSPTEPESAVPTELKDMTWDQIVAQAKTEGSLVFYSWVRIFGKRQPKNSRNNMAYL